LDKIFQKTFGILPFFSYFYFVINVKNMNNSVQLPDSFIKGLIVNVHVSLNGKTGTKQLKVCMVKTRSITFIEVDRENRQNIFRKVDRKDIVEFRPTAICEITVRDGILPVKWESSWDSIGQPTQMSLNNRIKPHFSKHSQGWAPKLPSTTYTNGFPMV
jgi:hypothetical protein